MIRTSLMFAALLSAAWVFAQDEQTDAALPIPSEAAARASTGLLLDVTRTESKLVAVGQHGIVLISKDAKDWQQVIVPVRATLTSVTFADEQHGWAVGHDAAIIHTADGGKSWSVQNFKPELNQPLLDVFFLDAQRGYAMGSFGLFLQTADAGKTWTDVNSPMIQEEGSHLNAMIRLGDGALLLVGERGFLARSMDGQTWDKLESPYEGSFFGAVPVGEKGALVFGLRGNTFLSAEPQTQPWQPVDLGTTSTAFGGAALGDGRVVLVGADGLALIVGADGKVSQQRLREDNSDGATLNSVAPWNQGYVVVGEPGVLSLGG